MLIKNIKGLVGLHPKHTTVLRGNNLDHLPILENAWLLIEDGLIKDFGEMDNFPSSISHLPSSSEIGRAHV